ncbi:hypothetical protein FVEN_g12827 [Fusarium venenatum]|nr:hypothetical protein FVEN_g12827 [Fusarium venenatum]
MIATALSRSLMARGTLRPDRRAEEDSRMLGKVQEVLSSAETKMNMLSG